jgi:hypothetical protein
MGRQPYTVKICHSRLMGQYSALVSSVYFYTCYPHGCNGEVAQRTSLHTYFSCGSFVHVAANASGGITAVLATKSDRMMISCWQDVTILGFRHTELTLHWDLDIGTKSPPPFP